MIFLLALLFLPLSLLTETNPYPFEAIARKGYALTPMDKSNEYFHTVYRNFSPRLNEAACAYGDYAHNAGSFLLSHCQINTMRCQKALDTLFMLQESLEQNNTKKTAAINMVIVDDLESTLPFNEIADPTERLKLHGINPKKYSWRECIIIPQLAKILSDTAQVLGSKNLTKQAGSYFLQAYKTSVKEGDDAYMFMKELKKLINKEPESDALKDYVECLQTWYNDHLKK